MAGRWSARAGWGTAGVFGCASAAVLGLAIQARPQTTSSDVAREKLSVSGVPVAGQSRDEVKKTLDELAARLVAVPVVVTYEKRSEATTPAKLGAAVDVKGALDAVFAPPPEEESLLGRIRDRFAGPDARDIPLPVDVSDKEVAEGLMRFSVRIGAEPRNARLTKVGGKFRPTPPRPGKELDSAAVAQSLQSALDDTAFRARLAGSLGEGSDRKSWLQAQDPIRIPAALREAQPRITLDELKPITATLASFSTPLGGSSRNRVHNIELACRAVDGTVLMPGDVFSYNDTVGPRVPSAGFREAPVIIKGELQKGTGGGICQVSSTLYNTALLADLEIVRRTHHAFPVHYLPAGRDATVVDRAIDFKFKNRLEHPIAIDAKVAGRRVVFSIYGHPDDKRQVEIATSGVSRVGASVRTVSDARLPKGRRVVEKAAKDGRRVTVTRIVKKDGAVIRREVVSRDYYRSFPGVVRVGTRVVEKPKTKAPASPGPEPEEKATPSPTVRPTSTTDG